jgi:hypothetical protein
LELLYGNKEYKMKNNKVDYPYCTRVGETGEICDSIKSQRDVDDYYRAYGRGIFIWHKTWEEAYEYVTNNIKKQIECLVDGLKRYEETMKELEIKNSLHMKKDEDKEVNIVDDIIYFAKKYKETKKLDGNGLADIRRLKLLVEGELEYSVRRSEYDWRKHYA